MSAALKDISINLGDFKSSEIEISYENLTTKTTLKNGVISIGGKRVSGKNEYVTSSILEIGEQSLVLDIPTSIGNSGHQIMLDVLYKPVEKEPFQFSSSTKIIHFESLEKGRARAELQLVQFDEKSWLYFQSIFEQNQAAVLDLFERIRGY